MNPFRLHTHAGLSVCLYGPYTALAENPLVVNMPVAQHQASIRAPVGGRIVIASTEANNVDTLWVKEAHPDDLLQARYVSPSRMFLRFADGLEGSWTFAELELDMSGMKVSTIRTTGTAVTVKSKWNDEVTIDASALRASIDPVYKADLEKSFLALRGPIDKL